MDQPSTFERSAIESDMKALAEQIKLRRETAEAKDAHGQEIVKDAIRSFPDLSTNQAQAQAAATATQKDDPQSPLPTYAQGAPAEVKLEIEYLIDLALRKGIGYALAESKKSSYFVQDAFHDALAGRLYPELKRQGIVK